MSDDQVLSVCLGVVPLHEQAMNAYFEIRACRTAFTQKRYERSKEPNGQGGYDWRCVGTSYVPADWERVPAMIALRHPFHGDEKTFALKRAGFLADSSAYASDVDVVLTERFGRAGIAQDRLIAEMFFAERWPKEGDHVPNGSNQPPRDWSPVWWGDAKPRNVTEGDHQARVRLRETCRAWVARQARPGEMVGRTLNRVEREFLAAVKERLDSKIETDR